MGSLSCLAKHDGVAAKLRSLQPAMVTVHCYVHKLELAFKDAIKHVPLDTKVTTCLLQGLYYFYHNNALNRQRNHFHIYCIITTGYGNIQCMPAKRYMKFNH